jgi:hypothetical protein
MQGVVDDAAKFKTQPITSDIFPPQTNAGKAVQAGTERILFAGTGPIRAQQQKDRISDVRRLFSEFGFNSSAVASDDVMRDLATKRASNFDRWETMKDQALETVATTSPEKRVAMPRTVKTINEALAKLRGLNNDEVEPGITKLLNAQKSFENQTAGNVLINKRLLGDVFNSQEISAVKKVINKELESTYEAVRQDLTDFIGTAGNQQAKNKWMIANKEETKLLKELDLDILKNTLEKGGYKPAQGEGMPPNIGDRPEVVRNMLFNKDRSVIEALNRNLSAKGRESARAAIMQEIEKRIGADASPERALTELRKMHTGGNPLGVFFTGDDIKTVDGLTRILAATKRAGEAGLHTSTGQQAYGPLMALTAGGVIEKLTDLFGGGITGTALGAAGGVSLFGLAGGLARAYESPAVRDILMKLPKVAAGSAEEAGLFKRLLEVAQAQNATKAVSLTDRRAEDKLADER